MKQFNIEQDRERGVQQDINKYGLAALGDQLDAGAIQRGIESEGILADREQFIEERDFPYKQVQYAVVATRITVSYTICNLCTTYILGAVES